MSSKLFKNIEEEANEEDFDYVAYQEDAKLLPLTPLASKLYGMQ